MPSWHPDQYLQFEQERTQPCRDLVSRIAIDNPRDAIDLGCGPGNSTAVLSTRWPELRITGLDSSSAMLAQAQSAYPQHEWIAGDIASWANSASSQYDVVLSNAALQWVAHHEVVFPLLVGRVRPGGVLAVQVPANINAPTHQAMRDLASSMKWKKHFPSAGVREWFVHEPAFYYDALASASKSISIWETEYLHVLPNVEAIGEWYKGTGLRPFLDALKNEEDRMQFFNDYIDAIRDAYQPRPDGNVLFPFRRLFLIAS